MVRRQFARCSAPGPIRQTREPQVEPCASANARRSTAKTLSYRHRLDGVVVGELQNRLRPISLTPIPALLDDGLETLAFAVR